MKLRDLGPVALAERAETARVDEMVTESPAMRSVAEEVDRAAAIVGGVLISGEPGTGRRFVARQIHDRAQKPDARFVVEDCAGDPREVEERLFGVAPDGPRRDRTMLERVSRTASLYRARGGTLLLEDVAQLPSRVQSRLARALRDQEAELIDQPGTAVDLRLRVIALSDSRLTAGVEQGHVSRDLYDRLAQIQIALPPLRQRREDIPALAVLCLRRASQEQDLPFKGIGRAALRVLSALPWRGNVSELSACMEALARSVHGSVIHLDDVLERVTFDDAMIRVDDGVTLRDARAQFEREQIAAVLARHHGRVGDAARALGIERTNLYRKVRALKVPRPQSRRSRTP